MSSNRCGDCDWLIVGGGGLFNCYLPYSIHDYLRQSQNFAAFIFGLPVLAFLLGKGTCIYGVGANQFSCEFGPGACPYGRAGGGVVHG